MFNIVYERMLEISQRQTRQYALKSLFPPILRRRSLDKMPDTNIFKPFYALSVLNIISVPAPPPYVFRCRPFRWHGRGERIR